jgi:hypothetical protein
MKYNEIYAGSPGKSISDKIGFQFSEVPTTEKELQMLNYLKAFDPNINNIKIVTSYDNIIMDKNISFFNVTNRTYTKRLTSSEIAFMKFLLPAKAKFTPI